MFDCYAGMMSSTFWSTFKATAVLKFWTPRDALRWFALLSPDGRCEIMALAADPDRVD